MNIEQNVAVVHVVMYREDFNETRGVTVCYLFSLNKLYHHEPYRTVTRNETCKRSSVFPLAQNFPTATGRRIGPGMMQWYESGARTEDSFDHTDTKTSSSCIDERELPFLVLASQQELAYSSSENGRTEEKQAQLLSSLPWTTSTFSITTS
jgi:hypothetical protein